MTVTTSVRHTIVVNTSYGWRAGEFDFQSRDIGCTQGTTISHEGRVVAHYQPGTRHWDRALETAEQLLAAAFERLDSADGNWDWEPFQEAFQAAMVADHCTPWDGCKIDAGEDGW